jgi:lipopolysaccharide transport protein LptA
MRMRARCLRAVALAAACAVLGAGEAVADQTVGVAPFEQGGTGGGPDVATLLADRLTTAGVACVGPDRLGVPAVAEPEPAQVQGWSEGAGVDTIVFGRVTGIGRRYSVDVQLRSAATGQVTSVHVTEIDGPDGVDAAVADLTRKVLQGLSGEPAAPRRPAATVAKAPAASGGSAPPVAARPPARKSEGGLLGGGGGPLRITSQDLEARMKDGARHMIFTDNVRATRGELVLTANRLDAFYPKGSSRPDRIVATGNVVMNRDGGEAHCQKMTYLESDGRIHCEGNAELVREGDIAKGDKIEWDVETDTIFVKGNADVLLVDEGSSGGS